MPPEKRDDLAAAIDQETEALIARVEARFDPIPPPEPEGNGRSPRAQARSLADILANPDATKPPTPIIPGIAWAGRLTLLAAREGVGKSTLLAAAAAAVTTGGSFLGQPCTPGTVLWVLLEEHESDLAIRAVRFQTAPDRLFVLDRPGDPLETLTAEVDRLQPALVICDTLHRFAALDWTTALDTSAAETWAPLMTALDRLARRREVAVVLSAQATKASGEYRDSSEIGHGVDVVLNLVRPDKDSPVRRLERQKARWPLDDLTFKLVGDTYERGGSVQKKLSPQRQKVLDCFEPPMSFTEWHDASGVPHRTFVRAVKWLVTQGYARKTEADVYDTANAETGDGNKPEQENIPF